MGAYFLYEFLECHAHVLPGVCDGGFSGFQLDGGGEWSGGGEGLGVDDGGACDVGGEFGGGDVDWVHGVEL